MHRIYHTSYTIPNALSVYGEAIPTIDHLSDDNIIRASLLFQDIQDSIPPCRLVIHENLKTLSPFQIALKGGGPLSLIKAVLAGKILEFDPADGLIYPAGVSPANRAMPLAALATTADFVVWSRLPGVLGDQALLDAGDRFVRRFRELEIPATVLSDDDRQSQVASRLLANL